MPGHRMLKYFVMRDLPNSKDCYLRKLGLFARKNNINMFGPIMLQY